MLYGTLCILLCRYYHYSYYIVQLRKSNYEFVTKPLQINIVM